MQLIGIRGLTVGGPTDEYEGAFVLILVVALMNPAFLLKAKFADFSGALG